MCLKCMISWLWVRDIILGDLGGPGSVRWKLLTVELRFPWRRNSASGQQLQLMTESPKSSLPVGLLCGIQTCLASPHNPKSQFVEINPPSHLPLQIYRYRYTAHGPDFFPLCCWHKVFLKYFISALVLLNVWCQSKAFCHCWLRMDLYSWSSSRYFLPRIK